MRDMGILSRVVPLLQHSNVKLLTRAVGVSRRVPHSARACALMLLAAQVVHNMSSDSSSIASIRHEQALPMLINLLKVRCLSHGRSVLVSSQCVTDHQAPQLAICGSAAGTLQNMSREHLSCDIIRCSFSSCCTCAFEFLPAAGITFDESCLQSSAKRPSVCSPTRCSGIEPLIDLLFGSDIASQVIAALAVHTWRAHTLQVCASGALLNCIGPSLSPVFEHPRRKALRKVGVLLCVAAECMRLVSTCLVAEE